MCTGIIARVRGVIFSSMRATSMFPVLDSASTRTGVAPHWVTAPGVATIVNVGRMTSSRGRMPERPEGEKQRGASGIRGDGMPYAEPLREHLLEQLYRRRNRGQPVVLQGFGDVRDLQLAERRFAHANHSLPFRPSGPRASGSRCRGLSTVQAAD